MCACTQFMDNSNSLAPPAGQSCKYITCCNFWTVGRNFKNLVSLESLGQAESNAPYDVIFRLESFSAILNFVKINKNDATPTILVPSSRNFHEGILGLRYIYPESPGTIDQTGSKQEAIKFGGEVAKQEVS